MLEGFDYSNIFGGGGNSAFGGGPNGMNPSNLMSSAGIPSPQSSPSMYQPGGSMYSMGGQIDLPYNPNDISDSVGQSVGAPDFASALRSMPSNGVAYNSPARAYLAAMRAVSPKVGQNANTRAMMPLRYGGINARFGQGQQIADLGFDYATRMQQNQQRNEGLGIVMGLLSPFLGSLMSGAAGGE